MTILALDSSVSTDLKGDRVFNTLFSNGPQHPASRSRALPRITLRKRPSGATSTKVNLETVNSAFLSGIFADVAKVSEESPQPVKKLRISKTQSMSRCARSFKSLSESSSLTNSPVKAATSFFALHDRQDSLLSQLQSIGTDTPSASIPTFPHLPATVSNSSCEKLTRVLSDLQSSVAETPQEKDSYGWFVEMEDPTDSKSEEQPSVNPYAIAQAKDLAFSASTAPEANNYDAEIEWAKAADTVDDVLGDFF